MEPRNKEIIDNAEETELKEANEEAEVKAEDTLPDSEPEAEESAKKPPLWNRIKGCELFTRPFKALLWCLLGAAAVYLLSRFIPQFAEFWTRYPAQGIRFIMAKLTDWIPFSLAEACLVALPIIAIGFIVLSNISTKRDDSNANFYRWIRPILSILLFICIIFMGAFGPAYGRTRLADNLGLKQEKVSAEELFETAKKASAQVAEIIDEIRFDTDYASVMPYSYDELVKKVNEAFAKYADSADYIGHFDSKPKPIALSEPMTYTHISGVYTFMTGEANINTNYPDFLAPFTVAHEMAHQRGIAREDEANFVAFLVCIGSDDVYVRYSGYANMVNYLYSALNKADKELCRELRTSYFPTKLSLEFSAYSSFFDKYRDSTASTVVGAVNNTYLQSQGQAAGTQSYGLVVDLAVAYYKVND